MNFSWLEDFLVLAETRNFSRAAHDRNMTQPAFSRRIRALEDWLQAPLFDRSVQPIRLTPTGEWFTSHAKALLAQAERLPQQAQAVASFHDGALRFCATHALSLTFLPAWLRGLEAHLPASRVEVVSDVLDQCEEAMVQGRTQFLLCHTFKSVDASPVATTAKAPLSPTLLDPATFTHLAVGRDALVCVSAVNAQGAPLFTIDGDQAPPLLTYSDASGLGRIVNAHCQRELTLSHVVFTAHLATMLRAMTLEGRGIAYLPESLIDAELQHGRLVPVAGTATVHLDVTLYRARHTLSAQAEALWRAAHANLNVSC